MVTEGARCWRTEDLCENVAADASIDQTKVSNLSPKHCPKISSKLSIQIASGPNSSPISSRDQREDQPEGDKRSAEIVSP